jgi:ABC-type Fe3+/spermidine/putrescine transport system ATPase subunit
LDSTASKALLRILPSARGKQKIFIRPEHFKIASKGANGLRAKINKVVFFGSYYEIEASLTNGTIVFQTETPGMTKGDKVYLSVSSDNLHYLTHE